LGKKLSSKEDKDKAEGAGGGDEEGFGPPPPPRTIPAKAGLNRFPWDLRIEDASRFKGMILWGGVTRGPVLAPGSQTFAITPICARRPPTWARAT